MHSAQIAMRANHSKMCDIRSCTQRAAISCRAHTCTLTHPPFHHREHPTGFTWRHKLSSDTFQIQAHAGRPTRLAAPSLCHSGRVSHNCRRTFLTPTALWVPHSQTDNEERAAPGIEPGTSRARSENHATRPSSQWHFPRPQQIV